MQQKKNIHLLISLTVMVGITVLIFAFPNIKSNSSIDRDLFQISNLDKIDRVLLESPKERTDLKFNGTKWMVNGKYEADRQMITVLFATLKQTVAKRQVAVHLQDSTQKEITSHGIKVSCFEAGTLSRAIWVGGNALKTETYFQTKDGKPYLVSIPGYRVYIGSIFELPSNDWRDKRVFNFNWQNIKSLEVTFPSEPKQNFKASFKEKFFSIEDISTDTTKLDLFMDALFQLHSEKILDSLDIKNYKNDLVQQPLMEIVIQDVADRSYPLILFPPDKGSKHLVGKMNDQVVLFNPLALQGIFRKKEYFVQH